MKFIRIYYEIWYARDTCLSTPNCSLSCDCSSAALLSVKSGDYTVVSYGSNISFQSKVHIFAIFDRQMFKLHDIEFYCSFRKKMLKIVLHKITY